MPPYNTISLAILPIESRRQLAEDVHEIIEIGNTPYELAISKRLFWLCGVVLQSALQAHDDFTPSVWVDDIIPSACKSPSPVDLQLDGIAVCTSMQWCDPVSVTITLNADATILSCIRIMFGSQMRSVFRSPYRPGLTLMDFDLSSGWQYIFVLT